MHYYVPDEFWVLFLYMTTGMKCNVLNRSSVDQDSAVLPFSFQINKCSCMFSSGRPTGVLPGEVYVRFGSLFFQLRFCDALTVVSATLCLRFMENKLGIVSGE